MATLPTISTTVSGSASEDCSSSFELLSCSCVHAYNFQKYLSKLSWNHFKKKSVYTHLVFFLWTRSYKKGSHNMRLSHQYLNMQFQIYSRQFKWWSSVDVVVSFSLLSPSAQLLALQSGHLCTHITLFSFCIRQKPDLTVISSQTLEIRLNHLSVQHV